MQRPIYYYEDAPDAEVTSKIVMPVAKPARPSKITKAVARGVKRLDRHRSRRKKHKMRLVDPWSL